MRFLLILLLCIATPAAATVPRIEALLDTDIGLLDAKLAIDDLLDASNAAQSTSSRIDALSQAIAAEVPSHAPAREQVAVVLRILHTPGDWNDHRPFAYDFDDPFAREPRNRLLSTYLATRRGNCVTMPVLFAILGRRLGLGLALAKAPHHLFVKVRDDDGTWFNVEATAGGIKSDGSYVRDTGASDLALSNGVYLRALTQAEEIATLADDVAAALERRGDFASAIRVTERMLAVDPRDVDAMVRLASLHARILDRDFHARWPNPADVPAERHAEYRERSRANAAWFAKAEALGWRQPSADDEAAYLRTIDAARETPARINPSPLP